MDTPAFNGEKYFITFIDDFSRYGYVYLLHEKSQSVNVLETFVKEVERQLETGNARFIGSGEVSGSTRREIVEIKETRVNVTLPRIVPPSTITPNVVPAVVEQHDDNEQHINEEVLPEGNDLHNTDMHEPQQVALRRPTISLRSS